MIEKLSEHLLAMSHFALPGPGDPFTDCEFWPRHARFLGMSEHCFFNIIVTFHTCQSPLLSAQ